MSSTHRSRLSRRSTGGGRRGSPGRVRRRAPATDGGPRRRRCCPCAPTSRPLPRQALDQAVRAHPPARTRRPEFGTGRPQSAGPTGREQDPLPVRVRAICHDVEHATQCSRPRPSAAGGSVQVGLAATVLPQGFLDDGHGDRLGIVSGNVQQHFGNRKDRQALHHPDRRQRGRTTKPDASKSPGRALVRHHDLDSRSGGRSPSLSSRAAATPVRAIGGPTESHTARIRPRGSKRVVVEAKTNGCTSIHSRRDRRPRMRAGLTPPESAR